MFIYIVHATLPTPLRLGSYWFSLLQSSFGMLQANAQMLPWFALQKAQKDPLVSRSSSSPGDARESSSWKPPADCAISVISVTEIHKIQKHQMQKFFTSKMSKNIIYSDLGSFPPFPPPCIGWQVFHPRGRTIITIYVITLLQGSHSCLYAITLPVS